jgi:hypothetical protein
MPRWLFWAWRMEACCWKERSSQAFHPTRGPAIAVAMRGLQVVLSSDEAVFGGYRNVTKDADVTFVATDYQHDGRPASMQVRSLVPVCLAV